MSDKDQKVQKGSEERGYVPSTVKPKAPKSEQQKQKNKEEKK